jgi:hypothetical protein
MAGLDTSVSCPPLFAPGLTWLFGAPGAVLIYAVAGACRAAVLRVRALCNQRDLLIGAALC